ncbi:hypothetical protein SISNIDRAFT_483212 [Sistotremastrum niveocremeum HHB9708]|uniref:Uncharacterized protein n=1 Tax=Sistotremastrum niveocremeum HHB9708 TaxID=1314777 RepID=A0A164XAC7_9AGAM|nr:hypothetical protein SISNIDRAFT_483212 [Sistotremastrum niveocremeum HHB9708]
MSEDQLLYLLPTSTGYRRTPFLTILDDTKFLVVLLIRDMRLKRSIFLTSKDEHPPRPPDAIRRCQKWNVKFRSPTSSPGNLSIPTPRPIKQRLKSRYEACMLRYKNLWKRLLRETRELPWLLILDHALDIVATLPLPFSSTVSVILKKILELVKELKELETKVLDLEKLKPPWAQEAMPDHSFIPDFQDEVYLYTECYHRLQGWKARKFLYRSWAYRKAKTTYEELVSHRDNLQNIIQRFHQTQDVTQPSQVSTLQPLHTHASDHHMFWSFYLLMHALIMLSENLSLLNQPREFSPKGQITLAAC